MTDVHHAVCSEIAADSALLRLLGIGGPQQFAHAHNNAGPFQGNGNDRRTGHEIKQLREKRFPIDDQIQNMGVMFPEHRFVKLDHLYAAQAKPFGQKTFQNGAGKVFPHTVGLQQNQRCFFLSVWHKISEVSGWSEGITP